jgi:hypothetical protein
MINSLVYSEYKDTFSLSWNGDAICYEIYLDNKKVVTTSLTQQIFLKNDFRIPDKIYIFAYDRNNIPQYSNIIYLSDIKNNTKNFGINRLGINRLGINRDDSKLLKWLRKE